MLIIGELLNGIRPRVARAIVEQDAAFIQDLAIQQGEAGADYLDVCAGTSSKQEVDDLLWMVRAIKAVTNVPLCLDSPSAMAIEAALPEVARGDDEWAGAVPQTRPPLVNSISGEPSRLEALLPLVVRHSCDVIVLPLREGSIPVDASARVEILRDVVNETRREGVSDRRLWVDPLIMAVATGTDSGLVALETIRLVREEFPDVHICGAASNVSFGLPGRSLINRAFITMAMLSGMDAALLNPLDRELRGALLAGEMVIGRDAFCRGYTQAYRRGTVASAVAAKPAARA